MTKTALDTAKARLHRSRKIAGVTDLQATTLSTLLDVASKKIKKSVKKTGNAVFAKGEAEAIVRETKGLGDCDQLDEASDQLVTAVIACVACELRVAGYAVYGAPTNGNGFTVSLV